MLHKQTDIIRTEYLKDAINFQIHRLSVVDYINAIPVERSAIVFMLSGEALVTCNENKNIHHLAGEMILLPRNSICYAKILQQSVLISCQFTHDQNVNNRNIFEQLTSYLPNDLSNTGKTLAANRMITGFFNSIGRCLDDGLDEAQFQQLNVQQLFLLLKHYYDKEQLACFFYPLLGQDSSFKDLILSHWQKAYTLNDLSELCNMSLSTFKRRFKTAFDRSPKSWLNERRAEMLYREILLTKLTYADITMKYRFSSQAYLCNFCKKQFGMTPHEIRALRAENK